MAIDLKFIELTLYVADKNFCKSARRYLGNFFVILPVVPKITIQETKAHSQSLELNQN